jgi:hypothetical protein
MQLIETFFDLIFLMAALSLRSFDRRRQYPADPGETGSAFHGAGPRETGCAFHPRTIY